MNDSRHIWMSHVTYEWICINSDVNRLVSSQFTLDLVCVHTQKSHILHTKEPYSTHKRAMFYPPKNPIVMWQDLFIQRVVLRWLWSVCVCIHIVHRTSCCATAVKCVCVYTYCFCFEVSEFWWASYNVACMCVCVCVCVCMCVRECASVRTSHIKPIPCLAAVTKHIVCSCG